jgi:hypothetical protein
VRHWVGTGPSQLSAWLSAGCQGTNALDWLPCHWVRSWQSPKLRCLRSAEVPVAFMQVGGLGNASRSGEVARGSYRLLSRDARLRMPLSASFGPNQCLPSESVQCVLSRIALPWRHLTRPSFLPCTHREGLLSLSGCDRAHERVPVGSKCTWSAIS